MYDDRFIYICNYSKESSKVTHAILLSEFLRLIRLYAFARIFIFIYKCVKMYLR